MFQAIVGFVMVIALVYCLITKKLPAAHRPCSVPGHCSTDLRIFHHRYWYLRWKRHFRHGEHRLALRIFHFRFSL